MGFSSTEETNTETESSRTEPSSSATAATTQTMKKKGHVGFASKTNNNSNSATHKEDNASKDCAEWRSYGYEIPEGDLEHFDDARCPESQVSVAKRQARKKEDRAHTSRLPWATWSRQRTRNTLLGCASSSVVLAVRLYLDREPLAYLIHSIIVFLDMILIHLFTNTWWLSLSGEVVTYASFLLFHYERETVYELLETTLIAVLCSFQMIASRSAVKDDNAKLKTDLRQLRRQTVLIMRRSTIMEETDITASALDEVIDAVQAANNNQNGDDALDDDSNILESARNVLKDFFVEEQRQEYQKKAAICGERFFEHFLDGSAGVMYTSFLGLIITELIRYGESSY